MNRYYDWKITPDGKSIIWIKQTDKKTIVVCDYNVSEALAKAASQLLNCCPMGTVHWRTLYRLAGLT